MFKFQNTLLKRNDYQLLDTQFMNDNVKRFGAIEIPKATYLLQLKAALSKRTKFVEADFDHIFS
jgi:leucyl/phenylalanyl-tRNA--protein transferase